MASLPPGTCCLEGFVHNGTPTGSIVQDADSGIEYYIAKPAVDSNKVIIYLTDIFGLRLVNHQLIADNFARQGFLAVIPNLFANDPIPFPRPTDFDFGAWRARHTVEIVQPIVQAAYEYVQNQFSNVDKFFSVGYCFGAKYVVKLLGEGKLNAGYLAHPSFVTEDELRNIKAPISIAAAETDAIFTVELRKKSEEILKELKAQYVITLYSGVAHGFASRGELKDELSIWSQEAAFYQAVQWFNRFSK
ncbi:dienelactone hydrolase [Lipomyces japonicus]|uniref:dienelactone hydrolase n=1 Tax=Lipomyces japonicus TaxID=56871 RepID=UPI0034CD5A56